MRERLRRLLPRPLPRPFGIGLSVALGLLLYGAGCRRQVAPPVSLKLATSTSYLESAAQDLLAGQATIVRLAEPGTCPGHFDIRPSQVQETRGCDAVLRFHFQKSLDARLAGIPVIEVGTRGGLCVPDTYRAACRELASEFVRRGWLNSEVAERRLTGIDRQLTALETQLRARVSEAGVIGQPVLTSPHQQDFAAWLGLPVAGTFRSADVAGIAEIERAIRSGDRGSIRLVIANQPEGRRTADALGERLRARVVVFGNFPLLHDGRASFMALLQDNVAALLAAPPP